MTEPLAPRPRHESAPSQEAHQDPASDAFLQVNPHKARSGFSRLRHAAGYSLQGLRAGWGEKAFRMEALLALVLLPAACWLARDWREWALLIGPVFLIPSIIPICFVL